jgi:hypothetical protein
MSFALALIYQTAAAIGVLAPPEAAALHIMGEARHKAAPKMEIHK